MGWGRGRNWCQNPVLGHSRGVESAAPGRNAVGHGWRGREQTPDERVGSRQPQTSDHCRLQLQDAQTQNVRSARWFPGVPEPREHNGTEFGSDSNHAAHGIAARFPRTRL